MTASKPKKKTTTIARIGYMCTTSKLWLPFCVQRFGEHSKNTYCTGLSACLFIMGPCWSPLGVRGWQHGRKLMEGDRRRHSLHPRPWLVFPLTRMHAHPQRPATMCNSARRSRAWGGIAPGAGYAQAAKTRRVGLGGERMLERASAPFRAGLGQFKPEKNRRFGAALVGHVVLLCPHTLWGTSQCGQCSSLPRVDTLP